MTLSVSKVLTGSLVVLAVALFGFLAYQLVLRSGVVRERVTLEVPGAEAPSFETPPADASGEHGSPEVSRTFDIVTVLAKNAIRAILDPRFVNAEEAQRWMRPEEQVIGLSINGQSKAYSTTMLNSHEIVNDVVGGVPLAVTW